MPGRFVAHARWLLDNGCHGLVVFGTTGEANSFSVDERIELLDAALSAGLPRERLLVGTGCCALTDTVRLTRHALALGIGGVLVLPPFYYKDNSDEALFASFDEVIQRVGGSGFKLYLYHFPRLSGVPITPGLIERLLARLSGHRRRRQGQLRRLGQHPDDARALPRDRDHAGRRDPICWPRLEAGASGCISASCNVNARAIRKLYDDFEAGRPGLPEQQEALSDVRKVLQLRPMIPVMKHLLADCAARARPGATSGRRSLPLPDVEAAALESELAALGWSVPLG